MAHRAGRTLDRDGAIEELLELARAFRAERASSVATKGALSGLISDAIACISQISIASWSG
jgi:hypothetical protein